MFLGGAVDYRIFSPKVLRERSKTRWHICQMSQSHSTESARHRRQTEARLGAIRACTCRASTSQRLPSCSENGRKLLQVGSAKWRWFWIAVYP
jgi:hypothetical protein